MNPDLNMLPTVHEDLKQQILSAMAAGRRRFLLWGLNETCIDLLTRLRASGIGFPYIVGIVDPGPAIEGGILCDCNVIAPAQIPALEFDTLVVTCDQDKVAALRRYADSDERIPEVILSGSRHMEFNDPVFDGILSSCLVKSYANGYTSSLIHIYQSIKYLAESGIQGDVAEFGIFKGGTVVFIAKTLAHFGFASKIYGFDIFDGFPARRSVLDLYSNPKCEFHDYVAVERYCEANGIEIVKGDICETHQQLDGKNLMLSFFDTDNYSPTRAALEGCFNRTVKGGVLAFDHYITDTRFLYTIGERMAAQEVLTGKKVLHLHGTGVFVKL